MSDLDADYNLELLATGVVLLDAELRVRALNLSAENLLEVSASRAIGSPIDALLACLLYTSPSPRDKRQSRMPSSA